MKVRIRKSASKGRKTTGFRKRSRTKGGRKILKARRSKTKNK